MDSEIGEVEMCLLTQQKRYRHIFPAWNMQLHRYTGIIACGEQLPGNSLALEAIPGVASLSKDNMCTGFTTEIVIRHDAAASIKVRIPLRAGEER